MLPRRREKSSEIENVESAINTGISCAEARELVQRVARLILTGTAEPKRGANDIYWVAWHAKAWSEGAECGDLADVGSRFLQLADALDDYASNPEAAKTLTELVRESADATVRGERLPLWRGTSGGVERVAGSSSEG